MTFISKNDLKAGDILLGYTSTAVGKTKNELNSGYVHASIYLGDNQVAEATKPNVQINTLEDAIEEYDHIAVLRQPDAWHDNNVAKLNFFVQDCIKHQAKFNLNGIKRFKKKLHIQQVSEQDNLEKYFEGKYHPESPYKDAYFCSELVVSAYRAVNFISESAAIIYNSEVISPSSLGKDPTFGTFVGYIKPYDEYVISESDQFFYTTPFHEIYGE